LVDARGGVRVDFPQARHQLRKRQGLEFGAQPVVRGNINELIAFDDRAEVEAGAAYEERQFPGARDRVDGVVSRALIPRQGIGFRDLGHVDEVVFDNGGLGRGDLAGAQVEAAIDLA
jgi:hypothetical protein